MATTGPIGERYPSAHAEVLALRDAARRLANYRLPGAVLYVTVEPCLMCAGACVLARVAELVFGAADEKAGAVVSRARVLEAGRWNHEVRVTAGVLADEARALVQEFFRIATRGGVPKWSYRARLEIELGVMNPHVGSNPTPSAILDRWCRERSHGERCPSGRRGTTGNRVHVQKACRGFKSLPLRHSRRDVAVLDGEVAAPCTRNPL